MKLHDRWLRSALRLAEAGCGVAALLFGALALQHVYLVTLGPANLPPAAAPGTMLEALIRRGDVPAPIIGFTVLVLVVGASAAVHAAWGSNLARGALWVATACLVGLIASLYLEFIQVFAASVAWGIAATVLSVAWKRQSAPHLARAATLA